MRKIFIALLLTVIVTFLFVGPTFATPDDPGKGCDKGISPHAGTAVGYKLCDV